MNIDSVIPLDRQAAWSLVCDWTESASLRRHMLTVEAAMRAYARAGGEDEELWGLTGLLHDLDYERYPDPVRGHPQPAIRELAARGYPAPLVRAIASHVDHLEIERSAPLERALFAVDELCGFITACALVRPDGINGLTTKSVLKKLKHATFAASVDRNAVMNGAAELGVPLDVHIGLVIAALVPHADELALGGRTSAPKPQDVHVAE